MRFAGRIGLAALLASTAMVAVAADAAPPAKAKPAAAPAAKAKARTASAAIPDGDWRTIGRDLALSRFSPLKQINRSNVAGLQSAWSYQMKGYNTASPLVIDGVMYFPAGSRVVALDADTGKEIWSYTGPAGGQTPSGRGGGFSTRGVGYWAGDARNPPRIVVTMGSKMLSLDARTGKPVASFGQDGWIDYGVSYGGTPSGFSSVAAPISITPLAMVGVPP